MPVAAPDMMKYLPDEVVLHILSFLEVTDLVRLQLVSRRYLALAHDDSLWKAECFNHSQAEALRLRLAVLNIQDPHLTALHDTIRAMSDQAPANGEASQADAALLLEARRHRTRAMANWEPGYPSERIDYYQEYIQRHAGAHASALNMPDADSESRQTLREATGVGLLKRDAKKHVVAPLDDGRICLWDISAHSTYERGGGGRITAQTLPGVLSRRPASAIGESHAIMTETGAVECVSIDDNALKGYFAVQNSLHEVDLQTLQLVTSTQYPFSIMALSQASIDAPLSVGTNMTIHLHDPRDSSFVASENSASGGELIGGSLYSHATLEQPGPLSILSHAGFGADDHSIWVAGRFTSLLNYDRRFFPRLRGTIFSGARVASLSSIPHPLIPRGRDLLRDPAMSISSFQSARAGIGTTILAAAEYKGKGSLELHGLPNHELYQNRQTASATKLLSVAPHGGRIVFSDGDGNIKWVERDGFSHVRTENLNTLLTSTGDGQTSELFPSATLDGFGQGDIVQKLIPNPDESPAHGRVDVTQSSIVLWTGEGRLAVLGFGHSGPLDAEPDWHDAVEAQVETIQERTRRDAEKQYGMAMRRALERNADEVRFVRGLGMGWSSGEQG